MSNLQAVKKFALDLLFPALCAGCGSEGAALCAACDAKLRLIPPSCVVCKKLSPARGAIPAGRTCVLCRKKSRMYAFASPFSYDTPAIRTLIHDLKYCRVRDNAEILATLLYRAITYHGVLEHLRQPHIPLQSHNFGYDAQRLALGVSTDTPPAPPERLARNSAISRRKRVAEDALISRDALLIPVPLHRARERVRGFNQSALIAEALGAKIGITVRGNILKKIKNTALQMALPREQRLKNVIGAYAVSDTDAVINRTIILLDDVKTTGATLKECARALQGAGAKKIWAITVAH